MLTSQTLQKERRRIQKSFEGRGKIISLLPSTGVETVKLSQVKRVGMGPWA